MPTAGHVWGAPHTLREIKFAPHASQILHGHGRPCWSAHVRPAIATARRSADGAVIEPELAADNIRGGKVQATHGPETVCRRFSSADFQEPGARRRPGQIEQADAWAARPRCLCTRGRGRDKHTNSPACPARHCKRGCGGWGGNTTRRTAHTSGLTALIISPLRANPRQRHSLGAPLGAQRARTNQAGPQLLSICDTAAAVCFDKACKISTACPISCAFSAYACATLRRTST
mmetsp:Transcript_83723/g.264290  ORF Transcript_83723/g.264290 Transcript_83723/m.264290 type:complete len:232 (+) Transcript_83723:552-1247(+)